MPVSVSIGTTKPAMIASWHLCYKASRPLSRDDDVDCARGISDDEEQRDSATHDSTGDHTSMCKSYVVLRNLTCRSREM